MRTMWVSRDPIKEEKHFRKWEEVASNAAEKGVAKRKGTWQIRKVISDPEKGRLRGAVRQQVPDDYN